MVLVDVQGLPRRAHAVPGVEVDQHGGGQLRPVRRIVGENSCCGVVVDHVRIVEDGRHAHQAELFAHVVEGSDAPLDAGRSEAGQRGEHATQCGGGIPMGSRDVGRRRRGSADSHRDGGVPGNEVLGEPSDPGRVGLGHQRGHVMPDDRAVRSGEVGRRSRVHQPDGAGAGRVVGSRPGTPCG